ncbi:hypothetical protein [Cryptosporangium minutisporangium]|uniref:hypothetical protein n=1 Tax=Cryptosporangium minutisporangium TaxID=113569 RepID=UPI0031E552C4
MTDEFADSAWGRDWIRLAQPVRIARVNPLIPRARSLARRHQVTEVVVAPGLATADVEAHAVRITVPLWTTQQRDAVGMVVAAEHDDLPDAVHRDLVEARLAPLVDVETTCTCVGRTRPCLHVLACFFELARRVDERPRLALLLRGLTRREEAELTRIPLARIDPSTFYG